MKFRAYEGGCQFIADQAFALCSVECLPAGGAMLVEFQGTAEGIHVAELQQNQKRVFCCSDFPEFQAGELIDFLIVRPQGFAPPQFAISTGKHVDVPQGVQAL